MMSSTDHSDLNNLSPFELKDRLIEIASSDAARLMLNAGRGNPNFVATLPRWAFLSIGEFALLESERSYSHLKVGLGGLPERAGLVERFESYAGAHPAAAGVLFVRQALALVKDRLGLDEEALLLEFVAASLGCNYPTPPRMLPVTETIVKAYLAQELSGPFRSAPIFRSSQPRAARPR